MYEYYTPVELEEHCLYAGEIAEAFGIYTTNGKLHTRLIGKLLNTIESSSPLYYKTKYGLNRCYRPSDITKAAEFLAENMVRGDNMYTVRIEGKNFQFKTMELI